MEKSLVDLEVFVEVLLGVEPELKPVVDVTLTSAEMVCFMSFREGIVLVDRFAISALGKIELEQTGEVGRAD